MAKNLIFGLLDHSKMDICDLWMILHDLVTLPKVGKHLVLSQSAISSRSNRPNSRKWPKTSFLALWIIQKCIFLIFEWSSMSHIMAKLLRPFSIVKICNIKLIRWTKLKKMANNWMDHSKRPTRRTKKNLKRQPEFFRTCGFRGVLKKRLLYHKIGLSKNSLPRFSVKIRSKLKNGRFWPNIVNFWMIQIFPGKTAVCVSYPYSKEHSCKKSEKSCARFSRKMTDTPTNQRTTQQYQV